MKLKILIVVSLALVLAGCSLFGSKPSPTVTETRNLTVDIYPPARPAAIGVIDVEWIVAQHAGEPLIGLRSRDYEQMIMFNFDVVRYIRQMHAIVEYYERSIEQHNERIQHANQQP